MGALKGKCRHFDEIFVTGCTGSDEYFVKMATFPFQCTHDHPKKFSQKTKDILVHMWYQFHIIHSDCITATFWTCPDCGSAVKACTLNCHSFTYLFGDYITAKMPRLPPTHPMNYEYILYATGTRKYFRRMYYTYGMFSNVLQLFMRITLYMPVHYITNHSVRIIVSPTVLLHIKLT